MPHETKFTKSSAHWKCHRQTNLSLAVLRAEEPGCSVPRMCSTYLPLYTYIGKYGKQTCLDEGRARSRGKLHGVIVGREWQLQRQRSRTKWVPAVWRTRQNATELVWIRLASEVQLFLFVARGILPLHCIAKRSPRSPILQLCLQFVASSVKEVHPLRSRNAKVPPKLQRCRPHMCCLIVSTILPRQRAHRRGFFTSPIPPASGQLCPCTIPPSAAP